MSVKVQFEVVVNGKTEEPYVVGALYDPQQFVAEVKKRIVAELQSAYDGFDSVKAGYLTLKALNGDVIMEDKMPDEDEFFLAELSTVEFAWREPLSLLQTEGLNWDYQPDPTIFTTLRQEVQMHYERWRDKNTDKQGHPLFLCRSGPGTGKSRLLQEFPRLVKESVSGIDGLQQLVNNLFCFNVSFENGTADNPEPFDPSKVIGTRMMYQLQAGFRWDQFRARYSFTITDAIMKLAALTSQEPSKMCVVLCIDGMQKLDHRPKSRKSQFYKTMSAICSAVNAHHAFVIAICSATVYNAVSDVLSSSAQRRVSLIPPAVDPKPIIQSDDELIVLLASDMGGHGRALENLCITLREKNIEEIGFAAIQNAVVVKIIAAYPDIVNRLCDLEPVILHVIAGKAASTFKMIPLDDLLSLGLFRYNEYADLLEFPYILWLLGQSRNLPWANYTSWAPKESTDVFATWEEWEHFNCVHRIIKSKAFGGESVRWMDLHKGAKFGSSCDEMVNEQALVFKKCTEQMNTASQPVGVWIGKNPCRHGSDTLGRCIYVGHSSPSGDSFVCLQSQTKGWIHEVHQDKNIEGEITYEKFCEERAKSAADDDFFILLCTGTVNQNVLNLERSAFVDQSCWSEYYGPFAARAFFVKRKLPPLINDDGERILRLVPGVGKVLQRQSSNKDASCDKVEE